MLQLNFRMWGTAHHPAVMGNYSTCIYVSVVSPQWMRCYLSILSDVRGNRCCVNDWGASWEVRWPELCTDKHTQKCSKDGKHSWRTDYIGAYCLDKLGLWHGYIGWTRGWKTSEQGCFDLLMASKTCN